MVIERRLICPRCDSPHGFLRQYMAQWDRWLTVFFQADGDWFYWFDPVVHYDFQRKTGKRVCHSFSDGFAFEKEDWEDNQFFCVVKMHIYAGSHDQSSKICIRMDNKGVPLEINGPTNIMMNAETDLYYFGTLARML